MIVSKTSGGVKWAAWAKRDGDWGRLLETIDALSTLEDAHAYRPVLTRELSVLPVQWDEHLWDRYHERIVELQNMELDEQWRASIQL